MYGTITKRCPALYSLLINCQENLKRHTLILCEQASAGGGALVDKNSFKVYPKYNRKSNIHAQRGNSRHNSSLTILYFRSKDDYAMNDGNMKGHKMKPIYLSFVFSDKSNPKDRAKGKAK